MEVDRTRIDVSWYAAPWGDGPPPEEWAQRIVQFRSVLDEDLANLRPMQFSIESATHESVPLSYQEQAIWQFHRTIDQMIDTSALPTSLVTTDILGQFVEA